jgi:hypothetical protein
VDFGSCIVRERFGSNGLHKKVGKWNGMSASGMRIKNCGLFVWYGYFGKGMGGCIGDMICYVCFNLYFLL